MNSTTIQLCVYLKYIYVLVNNKNIKYYGHIIALIQKNRNYISDPTAVI